MKKSKTTKRSSFWTNHAAKAITRITQQVNNGRFSHAITDINYLYVRNYLLGSEYVNCFQLLTDAGEQEVWQYMEYSAVAEKFPNITYHEVW